MGRTIQKWQKLQNIENCILLSWLFVNRQWESRVFYRINYLYTNSSLDFLGPQNDPIVVKCIVPIKKTIGIRLKIMYDVNNKYLSSSTLWENIICIFKLYLNSPIMTIFLVPKGLEGWVAKASNLGKCGPWESKIGFCYNLISIHSILILVLGMW